MRTRLGRFFGVAALAALPACAGFQAGVKDDPSRVEVDSLLGGFLSADALESPKADFAKLNVLGGGKGKSSLFDFDLWPLLGGGVGTEGLRARILNFEAGIGTPMGTPSPSNSSKQKTASSGAVARLLAELGK